MPNLEIHGKATSIMGTIRENNRSQISSKVSWKASVAFFFLKKKEDEENSLSILHQILKNTEFS